MCSSSSTRSTRIPPSLGLLCLEFFFFNDTATTEIYTLSLHDALPIFCNPPYRGLKSGRINPDWERRVARHEIKGSLQDFLRAGAYLLRPKGRMALIFPAARAVDLLQTMRTEGVEPKRLRLVHSAAGSAAALAL